VLIAFERAKYSSFDLDYAPGIVSLNSNFLGCKNALSRVCFARPNLPFRDALRLDSSLKKCIAKEFLMSCATLYSHQNITIVDPGNSLGAILPFFRNTFTTYFDWEWSFFHSLANFSLVRLRKKFVGYQIHFR